MPNGRSKSIDWDKVVVAPVPKLTGQKFDSGKLPIFRGVYKYFSRALRRIAAVSLMGYEKYGEWGGWAKVPDASERYADALLRHLSAYTTGEKIDPESGLSHLAHAAWNALAILELDEMK